MAGRATGIERQRGSGQHRSRPRADETRCRAPPNLPRLAVAGLGVTDFIAFAADPPQLADRNGARGTMARPPLGSQPSSARRDRSPLADGPRTVAGSVARRVQPSRAPNARAAARGHRGSAPSSSEKYPVGGRPDEEMLIAYLF